MNAKYMVQTNGTVALLFGPDRYDMLSTLAIMVSQLIVFEWMATLLYSQLHKSF